MVVPHAARVSAVADRPDKLCSNVKPMADQGVELERLMEVPFLRGLPQWALVEVAKQALEDHLAAGTVILRQHDAARDVHFLLHGAVQVLMQVAEKDLLFAVLREPGQLIGWSVFRPPFRYTTTLRCEEDSALIRVPGAAFGEIFQRDPALGYEILKRVAFSLAERFEGARATLHGMPREGPVSG
jgi:CRP-like cAMP-binding protein